MLGVCAYPTETNLEDSKLVYYYFFLSKIYISHIWMYNKYCKCFFKPILIIVQMFYDVLQSHWIWKKSFTWLKGVQGSKNLGFSQIAKEIFKINKFISPPLHWKQGIVLPKSLQQGIYLFFRADNEWPKSLTVELEW